MSAEELASFAAERAVAAEARTVEIAIGEVCVLAGAVEYASTGREHRLALRVWADGGEGVCVGPAGRPAHVALDDALTIARASEPRAPLPPIQAGPADHREVGHPVPQLRDVRDCLLAVTARPGAMVELRYRHERRTVQAAHTDGFRGSYSTTTASVGIRVTCAGDQVGLAATRYHDADPVRLLDGVPDWVAESTAQALGLRSATAPPSSRLPVVLTAEVAARVLGLAGPALQLDWVAQRRSALGAQLGNDIAVAALTVADEPDRWDAPRPAPFDDEGTPSGRRVLVRAGRLEGFLADRRTALEQDVRSTGSGWYRPLTFVPSCRPANLRFEFDGGAADPAAELDCALLVEQIQGMHTANPVTGDFAMGANGALLRHGERAAAVRDFTVAGNVFELLTRVEVAGGSLRHVEGGGGFTAGPALLASGLTISH